MPRSALPAINAATESSPGKTMPVPGARDPSGWPVYEVTAEGFAIALPPDWRQFDMNPKTFEAKMDEAIKQNPQLQPMAGALRQQVAQGVKFYGFDETTTRTGFATNINIIRTPLPAGGTLDSIVQESLRQYENMPTVTKPISHERLGDRERLRARMTMTMPNGQTATLAITQFILAHGKDGYAVTLTTLADQEAKYSATFDKIGQSFRFLK
ncbi:MAG TPA: hypothetical protein VGZ47_13125 [Gemmataceae bacterium]|nr:hypothetical protein [Gemmataceae bacterium]